MPGKWVRPLHTASPEPGWGLPVKSQKLTEKSIFFRKFLKNKKILGLKMTKKNSLQDRLKTSIPIFEF
jgi:hypothetical protein